MNTHIGLAPWIVAAYVQLTVIAWVSVDVRCRSHYGIAEDGCNGSTQIRYYQIIGECLKYAVRKDHITMNPMTKVDRPKKNKFRASYYTKDEATTLLDCAKGNPLYMPIVLGIFYGLRRSEAVGLQWSSIDFENNLIHIDHKAYEQVINGKAKVFLSSEMKTESSLRTLPLIPFVREELLSHKAQQEEYKKSFRKGYCKDWSDCVCVFPTGEIIPPGYISSNFKRFLTENNLRPIRYHDLRHPYVKYKTKKYEIIFDKVAGGVRIASLS
jgi:integrase